VPIASRNDGINVWGAVPEDLPGNLVISFTRDAWSEMVEAIDAMPIITAQESRQRRRVEREAKELLRRARRQLKQ
jgi:hypothetical protein